MRVFDSLDDLSRAGAEEFVRLANDAITSRRRFNVALSGGSTPKKMFELLALPEYENAIAWKLVHLFWSDERFVPPTDPQSNEHMAREALIEHVPIPAENVHGMYREGGFQDAAAQYELLLREELGTDLRLDLTLLGVGPDGHTASLFPGEPAVHEKERLVVAGLGHAGVSDRITMTPPLINRSRAVMFLVAGADKAAPMARILSANENWDETPAQAVARHAPNVIWLVDKVAFPTIAG